MKDFQRVDQVIKLSLDTLEDAKTRLINGKHTVNQCGPFVVAFIKTDDVDGLIDYINGGARV